MGESNGAGGRLGAGGFPHGKASAIDPQEILAGMIGTTRSRVSHFMNKFRKLGYIKYNGKLEIHNSLLNVVLYDKPQIRTKDHGGPKAV